MKAHFKSKAFEAALLAEVGRVNTLNEGIFDDLVSKIAEIIPGTSSNRLKQAIEAEVKAIEKQTFDPEEIKVLFDEAFKKFTAALYAEIRTGLGVSDGSLDKSLKTALRNVFNRRSEFVKFSNE